MVETEEMEDDIDDNNKLILKGRTGIPHHVVSDLQERNHCIN